MPAGSSVKLVRNTLDDAEVGGVSKIIDDMVLVMDGIDESRREACVDEVEPDSICWAGDGVGGP